MDAEFKKAYERLAQTEEISKRYDGAREQQKADRALEAMIAEGLREPLHLVRDDPALNAVNALLGEREGEAIQYVKDNLDSILGADLDKLFAVGVNLKNTNEKYKELAGLFREYKDFAAYFSGDIKQRQAVAGEIQGQLPVLIKKRILKKRNDEAYATKWAGLLLKLAEARDPQYLQTVLAERAEEIKGELKKGNLKAYITDTLKEDKDYLELGKLLYAIETAKKE